MAARNSTGFAVRAGLKESMREDPSVGTVLMAETKLHLVIGPTAFNIGL
jgi:hypothetical protein